MEIEIPEKTRKARVKIHLGSSLIGTYICVDNKSLPYRSFMLYQMHKKTYLILERCCDDSGVFTEELSENPIREAIEVIDLIVCPSIDDCLKE